MSSTSWLRARDNLVAKTSFLHNAREIGDFSRGSFFFLPPLPIGYYKKKKKIALTRNSVFFFIYIYILSSAFDIVLFSLSVIEKPRRTAPYI